MNNIKYFFEYIFIVFLFLIFKVFGLKFSSFIGGKILNILGPFFRSKKLIKSNILKALPNANQKEMNVIIKNMWNNYGRILAEYMFMKDFRNSKLNTHLKIDGQEILENIKKNKEKVIFISGHFNNFELMAMQIEKSGINVSAVYRPLNNIFLNKIMEDIRKNYICKNQIKKGKRGMRELLSSFKLGNSVALMIDQRVSEGIRSQFFGEDALTTTIPAQFVKKFNCKIVPIYIERINSLDFLMKINKPIQFNTNDSTQKITKDLNSWMEQMILNNPSQWIWTHNRWK